MTRIEGGTSDAIVKAPAKINIGLHIMGLRPDGYHEIRTILQQIALSDEILLWDAPDFSLSLTCTLPDLPTDERNLCIRAAGLLRRKTGCRRGVRLHLRKNIPLGAGLGGGSSDAAVTLKTLNDRWKTGLDKVALKELAVELGSDVPFFLEGGCCIASGRGELLERIDPLIDSPIVLVCPDISVSTGWAYKNIENYRLTSKRENIIFRNCFKWNFSDPMVRNALTNDFEPLLYAHYPTLSAIKQALLDCGAFYASLSGSGSSLYGVFDSLENARRAAQQLSAHGRIFLLE